MNTAENVLKQLSELCDSAGVMGPEIHYSTHSKKFYFHAPFEIKDGICLCGVCEHRNTIDEAAKALIKRITGELLVFRAGSDDRKEIFFYGAAGK